jgi:proteasome-associated ATPase
MSDREVELLRGELAKAKEIIAEQQEAFEQLSKAPLRYATVIDTHIPEKMLTMIVDGNILKVDALAKNMTLKRGDTVLMTGAGMIKEKVEPVLTGEPQVVQTANGTWCEISVPGGTRVVLLAHDVADIKAGDKVLLDPTGRVIIHKMPEAEQARFAKPEATSICWDDIGGNEEAKEAMIEAIETPYNNPAIYRHYNKAPIKGVLLLGPPGCGKTMLGKAAATAIAKRHHGEALSSFMYVKAPELLDPYVGVAEANIRALFHAAREHKAKHGTMSVIFIDEADAILGVRGTREAHMEKTMVPSFLTEMDGLDEASAIVILATNRPDSLDPAVVREGRIDRKVRVGRPDKRGALEIFRIHMQGVPLAEGEELDEMLEMVSTQLYSDELALYRVIADGREHHVKMAHAVSGSTIAAVVEQASSRALKRDIKSGKATGVSKDDLLASVLSVYKQNRDVNHDGILNELFEGQDITLLRKAHYVSETA